VSWGGVAGALLGLLLVALNGFLVVQPNQAKVAVFLGRYRGTVRRWVPLGQPADQPAQPVAAGVADRVIATLLADLQERLDVAGVAVLDTRLRRLAYAPEIAADMLRRQQADAIVAAR
jgi:regulator of protease activity HflC (stomatin/prohibitin superfamily)